MKFFRSIKTKIFAGFSLLFIVFMSIDFIPDESVLIRTIAAGLIFVAFFIFGNYLINKYVIKQINNYTNISKNIAQNDLSQDIEVTSKDEFQALGDSVNEMLGNLRVILRENRNTTQELAQAAMEMSRLTTEANQSSNEVTATMNKMATATEEQSENVRLSVTATQQMAETAQQVASEAQQAAGFSSEAANHSKTGATVIQELYDKITQLKESVDASAAVVRKLGTRSLEIGKIIDVMRSISRQTNLLALNAAIEAARAGEHGRGFSVVADEVRVLAEQSTNSGAQIIGMINEIQKETQAAVEAMEIGTKVVEEGASLAVTAKESFFGINDYVERTVNTIHSIAAAAQEQAASSEEMTATMQEVAAISKQNAASVKQVSTASTEQSHSMQNLKNSALRLAEMGERLSELVSRFKFDN